MRSTLACVAAAGALVGSVHAAVPSLLEARGSASTRSDGLPIITIKGNAFFQGDERFYIRGIDYQPGGSSAAADPLADFTTCSRDIAQFKKLGLNTIRVYTIDNSKNHDECMHALADAGIYLALDVNSPNYSINQKDPAPSYNAEYLQAVFSTIDAFAGYSNLLLFFSGNEDINTANNTNCAPYVKAVTRDMKQYIGDRGYRNIPVGYAAADVSQNQYLMAQYMNCGEEATRSDFYAINNYQWCSPSSYAQSGWETLVALYSNYSLPVFFSEYGCVATPRDFSEVSSLYSSAMATVISGGFVYEYSNDAGGWGVVNIDGDTVTSVGDQFSLYQNALANTPNPTNGGGYSTKSVVQDCPAQGTYWDILPFKEEELPAMPQDAVQYLKNGAGKPPGLVGGSQNAGTAATNVASAAAGQVTVFGTGAPDLDAPTTDGSNSTGSSDSTHGAAASLQSSTAVVVALVAAFATLGFGLVV